MYIVITTERSDVLHAGQHIAKHASSDSRIVRLCILVLGVMLALSVTLFIAGCGGGKKEETISGAAFTQLPAIESVYYNSDAAVKGSSCSIDISHVIQGYVAATGQSSSRLKLQVTKGDRSYNYDMSTDGSPIFAPINMGDGNYTFRIMQNTSGSNYIELLSTSANVILESEFEPFLRPDLYCKFTENGPVTRKARELTANSATEGDALSDICNWIVNNVKYDTAKAERLSTQTGYIPDPEETFSSKKGICFDYASLGAAMLRSIGIPAKIITGYVSPSGLYHAWIMVYIDGTWQTAEFSVNPKDWSRVDLTFAASGPTDYTGDGIGYEDRYVY